MDVSVDSVVSAINAQNGGARRLELCANLVEGGTTPSIGMLEVVKQMVNIPVYVMIRPRGGDFYFNGHEYEVMRHDIEALRKSGCDGIVIGMLNKFGAVDMKCCQELIDIVRPLPVTFHRAIDMTKNMNEALEQVIQLGCERVLTSGGESSALEGSPVIKRMIEQARGRIIVVPGGGITERNLRRILDETGAVEFHSSARITIDSHMAHRNTAVKMGASFGPAEYSISYTSKERVKGFNTVAMNNWH